MDLKKARLANLEQQARWAAQEAKKEPKKVSKKSQVKAEPVLQAVEEETATD